jgi:hypothetical protein
VPENVLKSSRDFTPTIQHMRGYEKAPPEKLGRGSKEKTQSRLYLLPRHGNSDGLLRRDKVVEAHRILGNGELNPFDATRKLEVVPRNPIGN